MQIEIQFIPHAEHQFTTIGHWFYDQDKITIQISQEVSFANQIATLFHELIEVSICVSKGITTKECDEFDALFEEEYRQGKWPLSVEAGFDPRCPYREGHIWGSLFERMAISALGVNLEEADKECDRLMGILE